jgi:hypothetical protein
MKNFIIVSCVVPAKRETKLEKLMAEFDTMPEDVQAELLAQLEQDE